jgi:hypothetical protein
MNLEKIETIFFSVLEDISDYLPDLTNDYSFYSES